MTADGAPAAAASAPGEDTERPSFDSSVAHVARVYDYLLGGKDNYAADRAAGEAALRAYPALAYSVRANRAFLVRAVRYLAGEAGLRQFLDIGTGIPAANNTHEIAQSIDPGCRIVYVDNDPIVLAHARALLTSTPEGATAYIDADLQDTAAILGEATSVLDFSRPVAVMLIAILHLISDEDRPFAIVRQLLDALPSGSYLAISHVATDLEADSMAAATEQLSQLVAEKPAHRTRADIARFFDGLEMVEPGLVPISQWRPATETEAKSPAVLWGGVARKP